MFEILTWILAAINIVGNILNAWKKIVCWYLWIFADAAWVGIFLYRKEYAEAVMFSAFFISCFYGIRRWRQKTKFYPDRRRGG